MFQKEITEDLKALGGLPIYLLAAFVFYLTDYKEAALILIIGLLVGYVLTSVLRLVFWRMRPDKERYHSLLSKIDAGSFPSLHSMRSAMLATMLMMRFQTPLAYIVFGASVLAVLTLRVRQKRHFTSDVVVGALLGVLIIVGSAMVALML